MNLPLDWLLAGDPWVAYRTRLDLLEEGKDSPAVQAARGQMLHHPLIRGLIDELRGWPGVVVSSHKNAGQHYHKLTFLADLGLQKDDEGMPEVIERVTAYTTEEGPFALPMTISASYGGSGEERQAWALCDAPVTLYALLKLGLMGEGGIRQAVDYLIGLVRENGWPCAVSKELGNFRGPGRKGDPCPYANLVMLKLLGTDAELREHPSAHIGAETILRLWVNSQTEHPYIFYMGNDFRKLKAPFVWYDLMHVLDVLSVFPWLKDDARLRDMATLLRSKADGEGKYKVESIWTAWKDWEFGQKKVSSTWLTLLAWRIFKRLEIA